MNDEKAQELSGYFALCEREHAALPGNVPIADYEAAADARLAKYWHLIRSGRWTHEEIDRAWRRHLEER